MSKSRQGFTLIELLVVIAIIGLLSTLAVVSLNGARQKARDARRMADVKSLQSAVELYIGDNETPIADPGTWALLSSGLLTYLPGGAPVDPGSNEYAYCVDANTDKYLVAAELESVDALASEIDGATNYLVGECVYSKGSTPAGAVNCDDAGAGNINGAAGSAEGSVFCMGGITS